MTKHFNRLKRIFINILYGRNFTKYNNNSILEAFFINHFIKNVENLSHHVTTVGSH